MYVGEKRVLLRVCRVLFILSKSHCINYQEGERERERETERDRERERERDESGFGCFAVFLRGWEH